MALIKCPDCATEVSDSAAACPKCSRPIKATAGQQAAKTTFGVIKILVITVLLLVIAGTVLLMLSKSGPKEIGNAISQAVPHDPPLPVQITRRQALVARGWVYQLHNQSGQPLRVSVTFKNGEMQKSGSYVLDARQIEIGGMEGWAGAKGDTLRIEANGYAPLTENF